MHLLYTLNCVFIAFVIIDGRFILLQNFYIQHNYYNYSNTT